MIGNVAFGLEMNSINDPEAAFRKMGKRLTNPDGGLQVKAILFSSFQTIAKKLHMRLLPTEISDFFMNSIRETVNYRLKNKIERNDIMDMLLKIKDNGTKEEGKISFNELAAQCKTIIILYYFFNFTNHSF